MTTAPYKPGDKITVTHDTLAGEHVTEEVTVHLVTRLTDGRTWRVETDRHGGGVMHLYVDAAGVTAIGEITTAPGPERVCVHCGEDVEPCHELGGVLIAPRNQDSNNEGVVCDANPDEPRHQLDEALR